GRFLPFRKKEIFCKKRRKKNMFSFLNTTPIANWPRSWLRTKEFNWILLFLFRKSSAIKKFPGSFQNFLSLYVANKCRLWVVEVVGQAVQVRDYQKDVKITEPAVWVPDAEKCRYSTGFPICA